MASNITAGVEQYAEVTNPTGLAGSITQNPFAPVEEGNNSAKSAYTTTASSGAPIPDQAPAASVAGAKSTDTIKAK